MLNPAVHGRAMKDPLSMLVLNTPFYFLSFFTPNSIQATQPAQTCLKMPHQAASVQGEHPWFDWMRQHHTTATSQLYNTVQPVEVEESLADRDRELYLSSPLIRSHEGDTLWPQMDSATGRDTTQATANFNSIEDFHASVSPNDAATLATMFDMKT